MTRLSGVDPASLSPEQRRVYDAIASGPRGGVRGPLAVWLHRAGLAESAQALGRYCRYETCLPQRLSELAIIVTGQIWESGYEWEAHAPLALQAGITPGVIVAVKAGSFPPFELRDERVVYDFINALHRERRITDELYREAVEVLGADAVIDLVGIAGYYTLISMTINVFDIAAAPRAAATHREQDKST